VFAKEADGLAAWLYRLGPGHTRTLPEPADGGGQYLVVTGGAMVADGTELPQHSVAFVSPDEGAYRVVASQAGLDLLVLQFPALAAKRAGATA